MAFAIARQNVPVENPFPSGANTGLKLTLRPDVRILSGLARVGESESKVPSVGIGKQCKHAIAQRNKALKKGDRFRGNKCLLNFTVGEECLSHADVRDLGEPILK
ncbi:MAG: hypothetical protein WBF04_13490 [Candidatus Sulfotelmatobacter sp.]